MIVNRMVGWSICAVILLAGCGCGSSDSSGSSSGGGPSLIGVFVDPGSAILAVGGTRTFTLMGEYSDGSQAPVSASWTARHTDVVTIDPVTGAALGVACGETFVEAASTADPTLTDSADVRVFLAGIYAADRTDGLVVYPFGGGSRTVIPITPVGTAMFDLIELAGMACHDGTIYWLRKDNTDNAIYEINPATGEMTELIYLGGPQTYSSLAVDSQGMLYTIMISGPDEIQKFDPATGQMIMSVLIGDGPHWGLEADENGNIYAIDINGTPTFVKKATPAGSVFPVAAHPGGVNFPTGGGLAVVSDGGPMFVSDTMGNVIFRYDDLNGDGDYFDAGESQTVGSAVYPLGIWWHAAEGSLLVNAGPGLLRLKDLNGDGDFLDAGENTLFSPENVNQGNTVSFMTRIDP